MEKPKEPIEVTLRKAYKSVGDALELLNGADISFLSPHGYDLISDSKNNLVKVVRNLDQFSGVSDAKG